MPISGDSADDIIMRMAFKMMDPAETRRLMSAGADAMEAELRASFKRQEEAFQQAAAAMTEETREAAKNEIKEANARTRQLSALLDEHTKAVKKAAEEQAKFFGFGGKNWRRTMEDLENFTAVATGAFNTIQMITGKAKVFAEEIIRVTNVMGSLKGSIAGARDAVQGTVDDMDLVIAKNQTLAAGLDLTDDAFAEIAKAADAFGDSVGIGTKEALDGVINSIAAGNERYLKRMGIIVDNIALEEKLAFVLEKTKDKLTEEEKRAGFAAEAMDQLRKKNKELADSPPTFALVLEQAMVGARNAWTDIVSSIGSVQVSPELMDFINKLLLTTSAFAKRATAPETPSIFSPGGLMGASFLASKDAFSGDAELEARIRQLRIGGGQFNRMPGQERDEGTPDFLERKKFSKYKSPAAAAADKTEFSGIERLLFFRDQLEAQIAAQDKIDSLKAERLKELLDRAEAGVPALDEDGNPIDAFRGGVREGGAEAMVRRGSQDFHGGRFTEEEQAQFDKAAAAGMEHMRKMQEQLQELGGGSQALGGLVSQMLFGMDGPQTIYDQMTEIDQRTFEFGQSVSEHLHNFGNAAAGAFGKSMAAIIGEGRGAQNVFKEVGHSFMMMVSEQMFVEAAKAGAYAIWDAFHNPAAVTTDLAAASAFLAAGTLAGGLARATYSAPASTGSASYGGSYHGSGPSTLDSGSRSGQSGGQTSIVINVTGGLGTGDEIADAILDRLKKNQMQTGRDVITYLRS